MKEEKILKLKKEELKPLYLCLGDELLLEDFGSKLEKKFATDSFSSSVIKEKDENFEKDLIQAINTLAFCSKKVIIAYFKDFLNKKNKNEKTVDILNNIPKDVSLFLICKGKTNGRLKLVKSLKKKSELVDLSMNKGKKLEDWIKGEFKREGYKMSRGAISFLANHFDDNLLCLKNEIQKIKLCFANEKETEKKTDDIVNIVSLDKVISNKVIFEISNAIMNKNNKKALKALDESFQLGSDPKMIIGLLNSHFENVLKTIESKKSGINSPKDISKKYGGSYYPYKIIMGQLKTNPISNKQLVLIFNHLLNTDIKLVSKNIDRFLEMEKLVLKLIQII